MKLLIILFGLYSLAFAQDTTAIKEFRKDLKAVRQLKQQDIEKHKETQAQLTGIENYILLKLRDTTTAVKPKQVRK